MVISLYESVFLGFVWYTIILLIRPLFGRRDWKFLNEKTDTSVIQLLRFAGIVFLFSYCAALLDSASVAPNGPAHIQDRLFGEHWLSFWSRVFTFFVLTQLFWFRFIRESKGIRIFIAICLLLILSINTILHLYSITLIEFMTTWDLIRVYFDRIRFAVIDGTIHLFVFIVLVSIMNAIGNRKVNQVQGVN